MDVSDECSANYTLAPDKSLESEVQPVLANWEVYLLVLLGYCGFSVVLALFYNALRTYIFKDASNLDTTFDAGGRVTLSLTAVTVATQMLWPADFIHSATVATWYGIAGPFWYAVGVVVNILVFPILSLHFKTRAPGAKTYLQIIYARYGRPAHIIFSISALLINLVIVTCIILAGYSTISALTENSSPEMVVILLAIMFGSYSFIGGIGTTFYVSYFNASFIFIMVIAMTVKLYYLDEDFGEYSSTVGLVDKLYDSLKCLKGPEGNMDNSYLTFRSQSAFIYGLITTFMASAVTFCDQASWQSRIAAKPLQGVLGFLIAAFIWYAMPSTLTTITGMTYVGMSAANNHTNLLSVQEIDAGFVTPFVAEVLLGKAGAIMVITMVSMALMSTGSGEVMAIASIIVYDIYQKYIQPYRKHLPRTFCPLCSKVKRSALVGDEGKSMDICSCLNPDVCNFCIEDKAIMSDKHSKKSSKYHPKVYTCPTHGEFRAYQDHLIRHKDWYIVWTSIALIPFGLIVIRTGLTLAWVFTYGAIITVPFCPAVFLCIAWSGATGNGLIAGGLSGVFCGVLVNLIMAQTMYPGGLVGDFFLNTTQSWSMLGGSLTSFGVSFFVTIIISAFTHNVYSQNDVKREWAKTMSINNPLNPWEKKYLEDFGKEEYDDAPTHDELSEKFRWARYIAYGGAVVGLLVLVVLIPGIMASLDVLDREQFKSYILYCHVWTTGVGVFVVFVPPAQEIYSIVKQYKANKRKREQVTENANGKTDSTPHMIETFADVRL